MANNNNVPQQEFLNPWIRQAISDAVENRIGFQIREIDQASFKEIIFRRTRQLGLFDPENYYHLLESKTTNSDREWNILISEVTNNESFFFRDKGQFRLLKYHLFPKLIQANSEEKILRICSAGCSTGEEPYSIAILLQELIPDIEDWTITILGIDINSTAIAKAKAGIYRPWSFRGIDADIKQRCFKEIDGNYQLNANIRDLVNFQVVNLLTDSFADLDPAVKDIDLILCRNVFIYFSTSAIKTVLRKFYNVLRPLGYLLVGHAELHSQNLDQFQVQMFEESMAYQRPIKDSVKGSVDIKQENYENPISPVSRPNVSAQNAQRNLETFLNGADIELQKASLDLLRQLPETTRIPRLGNFTVAELILHIEQNSPVTD